MVRGHVVSGSALPEDVIPGAVIGFFVPSDGITIAAVPISLPVVAPRTGRRGIGGVGDVEEVLQPVPGDLVAS